jgi:hypothetical protein
MSNKRSGTRLIWAGVVLLILLRQDFWFWHDPALVLGVLPVGLAWQIGISIAAALLWYTATRIAWPAEIVTAATLAAHQATAHQATAHQATAHQSSERKQ